MKQRLPSLGVTQLGGQSWPALLLRIEDTAATARQDWKANTGYSQQRLFPTAAASGCAEINQILQYVHPTARCEKERAFAATVYICTGVDQYITTLERARVSPKYANSFPVGGPNYANSLLQIQDDLNRLGRAFEQIYSTHTSGAMLAAGAAQAIIRLVKIWVNSKKWPGGQGLGMLGSCRALKIATTFFLDGHHEAIVEAGIMPLLLANTDQEGSGGPYAEDMMMMLSLHQLEDVRSLY